MQWHQLDHMQTICTSLQTDNHTNITQFLTGRINQMNREITSKQTKRTDLWISRRWSDCLVSTNDRLVVVLTPVEYVAPVWQVVRYQRHSVSTQSSSHVSYLGEKQLLPMNGNCTACTTRQHTITKTSQFSQLTDMHVRQQNMCPKYHQTTHGMVWYGKCRCI